MAGTPGPARLYRRARRLPLPLPPSISGSGGGDGIAVEEGVQGSGLGCGVHIRIGGAGCVLAEYGEGGAPHERFSGDEGTSPAQASSRMGQRTRSRKRRLRPALGSPAGTAGRSCEHGWTTSLSPSKRLPRPCTTRRLARDGTTAPARSKRDPFHSPDMSPTPNRSFSGNFTGANRRCSISRRPTPQKLSQNPFSHT